MRARHTGIDVHWNLLGDDRLLEKVFSIIKVEMNRI